MELGLIFISDTPVPNTNTRHSEYLVAKMEDPMMIILVAGTRYQTSRGNFAETKDLAIFIPD